jgi:PAS domain S-box-containing protein
VNDDHQLAARASLAAIVESSDDAILSKDLDGIIRSCNAAAERIFGYSRDELVGRPVRMLIPADRQEEEDDILARIRRGERVDHFETVRVRKGGRPIHVSLSISPIRDQSGTVIGASKIARDITERKLAQEKAAYLAAIISSSSDAIISKDLNGIITSCNEGAERIFGYSAAELIGRPIQLLIPPERYAEEEMILGKMRAGERIEHLETVRIAKDGRKLDISLSISPILDDAGSIMGVAKVARDITEQKRLARELAAQQEYFRVTLSSIGDGVIATDEDGRITFMNVIAEHLTGWTLDEARGHGCVEVFRIINEVSRRAVENPVTRVLADGVIVGLANHTILIAADGTERPIDDSGAPIRNRDGRIVGVVLVFRDIGDRRRIEAERRRVADERERLLSSERAARAEAERANRVKDEFVAMVSHELRTPLNAILGWTQLMMQSAADADVMTRGLDVISRNTRVQAQLVSDLLDVSRISSGKLRLSIEKVDLVSLVRNVIETVQQTADGQQVAILQEYDAAAMTIAGDPARLQQIVWNLLWNAIKFTPEGGSVALRVRSRAAGAEITVSDTGVGIKPEVLPHIFERFNQAHVSGSHRVGGLGLGLSIVKHLVDLHGGTIKADSPGEGQGATFTVLLPAGAPHQVPEAAASAPRKSAQAGGRLQGLRILVVEDEADTLEFLVRFLAAEGAEVTSSTTADDALAHLRETDAHLLISDIGLPDINGYDLLQRIRQGDAGTGGGIPAIALTAYARAEDRARAFRAGYQAHLAKPIEPSELVAAVARILQLPGP